MSYNNSIVQVSSFEEFEKIFLSAMRVHIMKSFRARTIEMPDDIPIQERKEISKRIKESMGEDFNFWRPSTNSSEIIFKGKVPTIFVEYNKKIACIAWVAIANDYSAFSGKIEKGVVLERIESAKGDSHVKYAARRAVVECIKYSIKKGYKGVVNCNAVSGASQAFFRSLGFQTYTDAHNGIVPVSVFQTLGDKMLSLSEEKAKKLLK